MSDQLIRSETLQRRSKQSRVYTQRSGKREELLKGPVAYGIVHGLAAMIFWRHSPVGIATISFLCAGDGLAEIVGTRLGSGNPLPFNPRKVWHSSGACNSRAAREVE